MADYKPIKMEDTGYRDIIFGGKSGFYDDPFTEVLNFDSKKADLKRKELYLEELERENAARERISQIFKEEGTPSFERLASLFGEEGMTSQAIQALNLQSGQLNREAARQPKPIQPKMFQHDGDLLFGTPDNLEVIRSKRERPSGSKYKEKIYKKRLPNGGIDTKRTSSLDEEEMAIREGYTSGSLGKEEDSFSRLLNSYASGQSDKADELIPESGGKPTPIGTDPGGIFDAIASATQSDRERMYNIKNPKTGETKRVTEAEARRLGAIK